MQVKSHAIDRSSSYRHKALVKSEPVDMNDRDALENFALKTAKLAGYHPAGYGFWSPGVRRVGDGEYEVTWESFGHCD